MCEKEDQPNEVSPCQGKTFGRIPTIRGKESSKIVESYSSGSIRTSNVKSLSKIISEEQGISVADRETERRALTSFSCFVFDF